MKKLLDLILYIFNTYPKSEELTKPRLVKIIYLIDWKFTILSGKQYTNIRWYFNHYGPYVDDVIDLIRAENDLFIVQSYKNSYGGSTDRISYINKREVDLEPQVKEASDFIINNTAKLSWTDFISLVYSSYPIKSNSKYSYLNLEQDAIRFKHYLESQINNT